MLPGPASQRRAGRAGREGTPAGAAEAKYAFFLLPCARGAARAAAGRAGRGARPRAQRAGRRRVRGAGRRRLCARPRCNKARRPPGIAAAAARSPSSAPFATSLPAACVLGLGASPRSGRAARTWHDPRAPRQRGLPRALPRGRDFFSPIPLPAIFRRGTREDAEGKVRGGATFPAPAATGAREGRGTRPGRAPARTAWRGAAPPS